MILPAMDISNGSVVRLKQGKRDTETIYGDPIETAYRFVGEGVKLLHVIDLDGALGKTPQTKLLAELGKIIPLQVGGGFRTVDAVSDVLYAGAQRVIIGTLAFQGMSIFERALELKRWAHQIVVAVDMGEDRIPRVKGWEEQASGAWVNRLAHLRDLGVTMFLCTATGRDGMMQGPDLNLYQEWRNRIGWEPHIIAAGGVRNGRDAKACLAAGANEVVVGRALYEGENFLQGFTS